MSFTSNDLLNLLLNSIMLSHYLSTFFSIFSGCGSGKYLGINPVIFNIGSDRCHALAQMAREKEHEVMFCDNLALPFRDSSIDAVLSIAVIHHIATAERRVHALRELSRVLRVSVQQIGSPPQTRFYVYSQGKAKYI